MTAATYDFAWPFDRGERSIHIPSLFSTDQSSFHTKLATYSSYRWIPGCQIIERTNQPENVRTGRYSESFRRHTEKDSFHQNISVQNLKKIPYLIIFPHNIYIYIYIYTVYIVQVKCLDAATKFLFIFILVFRASAIIISSSSSSSTIYFKVH